MGVMYEIVDGSYRQGGGHSERPWWAGRNLLKAAYYIHIPKDREFIWEQMWLICLILFSFYF